MTVEQPSTTGHVWIVNSTHDAVDIYVNYADQPSITDAKPREIGPVFEIDGTYAKPYGAYTFSARLKSDPESDVLAAASVYIRQGDSFCAVLHRTETGTWKMSIYKNDFSATAEADSRLTVRHNAWPPGIEWRIAPKDVGTSIPRDEREGALQTGQWQSATSVIENDYVFEVLVAGNVVARHPDLELEHEKMLAVYVAGDLQPTTDSAELRRRLLVQEFQTPAGPSRPGEITPPAAPLYNSDQNAEIEFACNPVEVWETNAITTYISAKDPDGVINNLSVDRIDPDLGSIEIRAVKPSPAVGETGTAIVDIGTDVPDGTYAIHVIANRGTLAQKATCVIHLTVKPITIPRLQSDVNGFEQSGYIEDSIAAALQTRLEQAAVQLQNNDVQQACNELKEFVATVESSKNKGIAEVAATVLLSEGKALRGDLGCG